MLWGTREQRKRTSADGGGGGLVEQDDNYFINNNIPLTMNELITRRNSLNLNTRRIEQWLCGFTDKSALSTDRFGLNKLQTVTKCKMSHQDITRGIILTLIVLPKRK